MMTHLVYAVGNREFKAVRGELTHEDKLDLLAKIAVTVGLGLRTGQEVILSAPLQAISLVKKVTRQAYEAGASQVTTLFSDDDATLARFQYASDSAFDYAPGWLYEGMANAYRGGAARLTILGDNPTLLSQQNPDKVARANRARSIAYRPALDQITSLATNWSIVCCATPSWASLIFPELSEREALTRLWDAIFEASRVNHPDPIAAWTKHNTNLHARTSLLNGKRYRFLLFRGPGTNLKVGLADGHLWLGGSKITQSGISCIPNIPTEEVFTTPHLAQVDGFARSTKPLSYQGTLIKDIVVRFEMGRIVDASSSCGQNVLHKILDTDEGARRLGEVALVPHSSPISASGLLFYNTLFDENAASHIAIGQAYRTALKGGTAANAAELACRGANTSLIHIDWMIGSDQMDVDGVLASGEAEALMRAGEWI